MLSNLREFLRGKKAYLTAASGILAAVIAWADGDIGTTALVAAVWAGIGMMAVRAGIANAVRKVLAEKADSPAK